MRDVAKQIRADMRKALQRLVQERWAIRESEDEKFPADHRVTRQRERAEIDRKYAATESLFESKIKQWEGIVNDQIAHLREQDPLGTPEQETRRLREEQEIARLAAPVMGSPAMARSRLLPEARRLMALNLPDKARVYLEAAERAGAPDTMLRQSLERTYDRTIPSRQQAIALATEAKEERDLFDLDRYSMRVEHGIGNTVAASTGAKLQAYRLGGRSSAGMVTPADAEAHLASAQQGDRGAPGAK